MDGLRGLEGWRWVFIIEGVITAAYGICVRWLVVDWPDEANYLNDDEKALQKAKMTQDDGEASMDRLTPATTKRIFLDWKIYLGCMQVTLLIPLSQKQWANELFRMYIGTINTTYAVSFFVPTIIAVSCAVDSPSISLTDRTATGLHGF